MNIGDLTVVALILALTLSVFAGCERRPAVNAAKTGVGIQNEFEASNADLQSGDPQFDKRNDVFTFNDLGVQLSCPPDLEITITNYDNGDKVIGLGSHSLKISDGKLFFDDIQYGAIESGQMIIVSGDKILSVRERPIDSN